MLTQAQIEFYRQNGYLLVKGVLSKAEAAAYRQEGHALIERLSQTANLDATWGAARQVENAKDTKIFHCHNVQFYSALFGRLLTDPRLTDPTAHPADLDYAWYEREAVKIAVAVGCAPYLSAAELQLVAPPPKPPKKPKANSHAATR